MKKPFILALLASAAISNSAYAANTRSVNIVDPTLKLNLQQINGDGNHIAIGKADYPIVGTGNSLAITQSGSNNIFSLNGSHLSSAAISSTSVTSNSTGNGNTAYLNLGSGSYANSITNTQIGNGNALNSLSGSMISRLDHHNTINSFAQGDKNKVNVGVNGTVANNTLTGGYNNFLMPVIFGSNNTANMLATGNSHYLLATVRGNGNVANAFATGSQNSVTLTATGDRNIVFGATHGIGNRMVLQAAGYDSMVTGQQGSNTAAFNNNVMNLYSYGNNNELRGSQTGNANTMNVTFNGNNNTGTFTQSGGKVLNFTYTGSNANLGLRAQ